MAIITVFSWSPVLCSSIIIVLLYQDSGILSWCMCCEYKRISLLWTLCLASFKTCTHTPFSTGALTSFTSLREATTSFPVIFGAPLSWAHIICSYGCDVWKVLFFFYVKISTLYSQLSLNLILHSLFLSVPYAAFMFLFPFFLPLSFVYKVACF